MPAFAYQEGLHSPLLGHRAYKCIQLRALSYGTAKRSALSIEDRTYPTTIHVSMLDIFEVNSIEINGAPVKHANIVPVPFSLKIIFLAPHLITIYGY